MPRLLELRVDSQFHQKMAIPCIEDTSNSYCVSDDDVSQCLTDDVCLWLSVIRQAIDDATSDFPTGCPHKSMANHVRESARIWLIKRGPEFKKVCEYAGLEPLIVWERMKRLESSGWSRSMMDDLGQRVSEVERGWMAPLLKKKNVIHGVECVGVYAVE